MSVRDMTAETLNALKGWPIDQPVDYEAQFDATELATVTRVPAGACVHIGDDGNYRLGVGNLKVMPMFTFDASDFNMDPSLNGDPSTEFGVTVPVTLMSATMALVAVGSYELVSTNFVSDTYKPNDYLTSAVLPNANPGKLAKGTLGTDMIVGQVSRGIVDNGYHHDGLAFWPVVLPKYT